jgi:deoxyribodipyrimidine photolyase-related protein
MQLINATLDAYNAGNAPVNSVEGFIRQVLGWREFMYWQYHRLMPDLPQHNAWNASRDLPDWFWSGKTALNCLHHVITRTIDYGYNHHIERLMVLTNFFVLAGIEPRQVLDWFNAAYIDAYDWVMHPNVMGMGLNADGGIIATKPYIASANYINKMSDYCKGCQFSPKHRTGSDACPFNFLYWSFLLTHEETLRANPRFGPNVLGLRYLDDEERSQVSRQASGFLAKLHQDS